VPLKRGMDDISYIELFKNVMNVVMGSYRPDVVVIQCGADSLSKDKLGHFNLSIRGHANCIKHMMTYNTPLILLGGGGYTI
jgi:histone deacetylase 1/2